MKGNENMSNVKERNKITVTEFVKKYNSLTSSELKFKYIESNVYRTYVPILEKKIWLQKMFDQSVVGEIGNQYIDMFVHKFNTTLTILEMYTNISFNKGVEETGTMNVYKDYDLLAENDLLNAVFAAIPKSELSNIIEINEQIIETFYNKHQSTKAYIAELVDKFSLTMGAITDTSIKALLEILNDEEKIKDIISKLPKLDSIEKILNSSINKL